MQLSSQTRRVHDGLPYLCSLMFTMAYLTYVH